MISSSHVQEIAHWFIPERLKKDFIPYRQSKVIVYFSLIGLIFYTYNSVKWYNLNIFILAKSLSIIVCLTIAMLFYLKFTGRYKIVGHVTIMLLFFHFSFLAYLGGGLDAKSILWNLLIPIMSYIIIGSRPTLIWFFAVLCEIVIFYALKKDGHIFPGLGLTDSQALAEQTISIVGPLCSLTIIVLLFEMMNNNALMEMKHSQQQSQQSADFLRNVIGKVTVQSKALAESSQSLLDNGDRMTDNINATSKSVSEIISLVNSLSSLTNKVNLNSSEVMNTSDQGLNTTSNAMSSVENMKDKMAQIEKSSSTSTKEIVELNEHSKKINNIMNIINNVADQTKLIAFNASLEASSAGEAGKRFSVVAVEIRRLADNVMESTSEIRTTIKSINESVGRLLVYSEQESKDIQEGIVSLVEIVNILKQILSDAKIQTELAKDIIQRTDEQTSINKEVLAKTEEISNGTYETLHSIQQSGKIATKLADVSTELRQHLKNT